MQIFILDADDTSLRLESYSLQNSGMEIKCFKKRSEMLNAVTDKEPGLFILCSDGFEVTEKDIIDDIRCDGRTLQTPIFVLSENNDEIEKVNALDRGADDYMVKPLAILEFSARVRALVRRSNPVLISEKYSFHGIVLDDACHIVTVNGAGVELTYKEYELLKYLLMHRGTVLTRAKLIDTVWGFNYTGASRTVDMHVKTLRAKLGEGAAYIKTVRNVGYKLCD